MNIEPSQTDILKKYLNLFFAWHKLILFVLLAGVTLALFVYLNQSSVYESTASVMYQQQRINPSQWSPDDERQIAEMVNTLTQQVLSRSTLERIIREHDLYSSMRQNVPIEEVVKQMREWHVSVNLDRGRGNVFSVSYRNRDPENAMKVTNALASRFIEENLRLREERAAGTSRYIREELRMSKEVLEEKEAEMRDYKLKHYNEMPEQRASNVTRLNALQEQHQSTQRRINDLEQTRLLVSEQLETRRDLQRLRNGAVGTAPESRYDRRDDLAEARRNLQELLSRYTAEHPLVRRAETRVRQLESERQAALLVNEAAAEAEEGAPIVSESMDPRINELSVQLREIDLNLKALRSDAESTRAEIKKYQAWIDAVPIREAEWSALTRDYEQHRNYHDNLVAQSLAAEAAESLERRQQGSQFRVVDPAYMPTVPLKGTFLKTLFMAAAGGLLAGFGLVAGFSMLDTSFKNAAEIEDYLQVPVICAVPLIVRRTERRFKIIKNVLWGCFFTAWAIGLAAATVHFYMQGELFI